MNTEGAVMSMFRRVTGGVYFLVCISFITYRCDRVSTEEVESQVTLTQLLIEENDVQQWTQDADGYTTYKTSTELYALINGGADEYINRGMLEGFQQLMSRSGTDYAARVMVMNFGTIAKADDIYNFRTSQVSPTVKAGDYGAATAILDPAPLTGCNGYARFRQYYLEFGFTGYGSEKSEAYNNAALFMEMFVAKITAE
jgi:hypothetical protein